MSNTVGVGAGEHRETKAYLDWLVTIGNRLAYIAADKRFEAAVAAKDALREFVVQPQRWKIERTFGWLGWSRILSKEYERTTESSESNIYLASIRLMLRRLPLSPK